MPNTYVAVLELAAFLTSLLVVKKKLVFRLLCLLLLLTVVNEWWLVPSFSGKKPFTRNEMYNAFSLLDITVWFVVFYLVFKNSRWRIVLPLLYAGVIAYTIAELFYLKNWRTFHTDSMRVYSLCIIVLSSTYFYSKLRAAYYLLTADPFFWLSAACFFFHSVLFISLTTQTRPEYFNIQNAREFFFILHNIGNTLYYGLLMVSFLVCYFNSYNKALD